MNLCPVDISEIKRRLYDCPDIVQRKVFIESRYEAYIFYISNHIDKDLIQRDFIAPILTMSLEQLSDQRIIHNLPCAELTLLYTLDEILNEIFSGASVFVCSQAPYIFSYKNENAVKRNIEEPITEKNIRGPHEGFIEPLDANLSILRRKLKTEKLKFKTIVLGKLSHQTVVIAYIEDLANIDIVENVYRKISTINTDGMLSVEFIEQHITSRPNSLFPEFLSTERPDKAVASLLSGSIVIMQSGTPACLIAPVNFFSFFQALDDYGSLWLHGSFLRMIRIFGALFIAVLLPALYISVTTFHYYAVPLNLLITLAESRSKVPFPPIMEVLILEITVELLREAAIRLPSYIGSTVSIMAGLIVGQAAVEAGIVSGLVIVIVGATAVASYVVPAHDMALSIRILRFIFLVASSIFGMIGIVVCTTFTISHLMTMDSLGQPYFMPFSPLVPSDLKDTIIRAPVKKMKKRPHTARPQDPTRGS